MPCGIILIWDIRPRFHGLSPGYRQVAYALRTRAPVASNVLLHPAAPRLACVKPAASVHPEPGSNSSLYELLLFFSTYLTQSVNFMTSYNVISFTRYPSFHLFQCTHAPFSKPPRRAPLFLESECKDTTLFFITKIFFEGKFEEL